MKEYAENYWKEDELTEPVVVERKKNELSVKSRGSEIKRQKIVRLMTEEGLTAKEAVKAANSSMTFYYNQLKENKEFRDSIQFAEEFMASIAELTIRAKLQKEHENVDVGGDIKTTMWFAEHRMPQYKKNTTTTHEVGETLFDMLKSGSKPKVYDATVVEDIEDIEDTEEIEEKD